MTISEALSVLGLDNPTTKQKIQQSYRRLVKEFHPDRYYNAGATEAWATRKFIKIKNAYDLLMMPESSNVIIEEADDIRTEDVKNYSKNYSTKEHNSSATAYPGSSDEEELENVSVTRWLLERLDRISNKWKIVDEIADILLMCVFPVVIPLFIFGSFTYGFLYIFMHEIMGIKNKRILQIITRIVVIIELSLIFTLFSTELNNLTIYAYAGGAAIIFSIFLMMADLLSYLLSSIWKRSIVLNQNAIVPVSEYSQYKMDEFRH